MFVFCLVVFSMCGGGGCGLDFFYYHYFLFFFFFNSMILQKSGCLCLFPGPCQTSYWKQSLSPGSVFFLFGVKMPKRVVIRFWE